MRPVINQRERGAVAVLVAMMATALFGLMALGFNVGHMMKLRGQLQTAAEAGALAGAIDLDGETATLATARANALDWTQRHKSDNTDVAIDGSADIIFGHWDTDTALTDRSAAFTPATVDMPSTQLNAVLVRTGREASRGSAMDVFFGGLLGLNTVDVRAEAVAVGGGPSYGECVLPIAFASCLIRPDPNGPLICNKDITFSTDSTDTAGFTSLSGEAASNNEIRDMLQEGCQTVRTGAEINLQNGNDMNNNVVNALAAYVAEHGRIVRAPIMKIDDCSDANAKFNQTHTVEGIAEFEIVDWKGPPGPFISIRYECDGGDSDQRAGGGFFGVDARPRLVR